MPTFPEGTEVGEEPEAGEETHAEPTGSKASETGGEGLIYQEPQRSLAMSGRAKVLETVSVKTESKRMERSRLRAVGGEWVWRGRWATVGETRG